MVGCHPTVLSCDAGALAYLHKRRVLHRDSPGSVALLPVALLFETQLLEEPHFKLQNELYSGISKVRCCWGFSRHLCQMAVRMVASGQACMSCSVAEGRLAEAKAMLAASFVRHWPKQQL